jgi:hypothetical protein
MITCCRLSALWRPADQEYRSFRPGSQPVEREYRERILLVDDVRHDSIGQAFGPRIGPCTKGSMFCCYRCLDGRPENVRYDCVREFLEERPSPQSGVVHRVDAGVQLEEESRHGCIVHIGTE